MYTLGIRLYTLVLHIAAFFHPKARLWVQGRRQWRQRYAAQFQVQKPVLWVHAASLGEFEQGRPVIEAAKEKWPQLRIVLTFFSPSGYEIRKNYPQADFIAYLPADTPENARHWLDIIQPAAVIFIKYEFWANYLFELKRRNIPTTLISAIFRPEQPFFKPWGGLWRKMLDCYEHFFVQNTASASLLEQLGYKNLTIAGDTRVDRVLKLARQAPENELVAAFTAGRPVLVAGSAWAADEAVFLPVLSKTEFQHYKIIIAPHEPSEAHLRQLEAQLRIPSVRYSRAADVDTTDYRVLIIDNVGMLNTLYRYGKLAFIGGGFGRGIHNILEPAAYGLPVVFGPNYSKFEEARALVAQKGAFCVHSEAEFEYILRLLSDAKPYEQASSVVGNYLEMNAGATNAVFRWVEARVFKSA